MINKDIFFILDVKFAKIPENIHGMEGVVVVEEIEDADYEEDDDV